MEKQEAKNVKEVFKDYDSNSFELNAARVVGINLYKNFLVANFFVSFLPRDTVSVVF